MCEVEFDSIADVWSERHRKAAKPHRCSCCDVEIAKGERYLSHFSITDGNPNPECLCSPCETIRELFAVAHGNQTPCPSSVLHYLAECTDTGHLRKGADTKDRDEKAGWLYLERFIINRIRAARRERAEVRQ